MLRYIQSSSRFNIDRRYVGGLRSQRGVRKVSLEVFFRTDVIDVTPYYTAATQPQLRFRSSQGTAMMCQFDLDQALASRQAQLAKCVDSSIFDFTRCKLAINPKTFSSAAHDPVTC
jgi:hypothetical protein